MIHLITGATSSIGKVLVRESLGRGERVRAFVRPNSRREAIDLPGVEFAVGDMADFDSLRRAMEGADLVSNLAAVVGAKVPEAEWWHITRDGAANALRAARESGVRSYVQVSSLSVLGDTAPGEVRDEAGLPDHSAYTALYQRTKRAADDLVRQVAVEGLPAKIVYPGFGYGCSRAQSHPGMAEATLLRMASGKPVAILGSGRNRLCVAYYRDTAKGILLAHDRGRPGEGYVLCNGNFTFPEIWAAVARTLGRTAPKRKVPLGLLKVISSAARLATGSPIFPGDFFDMIAKSWAFSNEKAKRELGFSPLGLQESMDETWREFRLADPARWRAPAE
jgi:Nucleoside-diphosphate-sugar epimerases